MQSPSDVRAAPLTYSTPGTEVVVVTLTDVVVSVICVELVDVADVSVLVVEVPVVIVWVEDMVVDSVCVWVKDVVAVVVAVWLADVDVDVLDTVWVEVNVDVTDSVVVVVEVPAALCTRKPRMRQTAPAGDFRGLRAATCQFKVSGLVPSAACGSTRKCEDLGDWLNKTRPATRHAELWTSARFHNHTSPSDLHYFLEPQHVNSAVLSASIRKCCFCGTAGKRIFFFPRRWKHEKHVQAVACPSNAAQAQPIQVKQSDPTESVNGVKLT